METKPLKIENINNKLECIGFIVIHFAPERPIPEREMDQLYVVNHEGKSFLVKCVDFLRLPFWQIGDQHTVPASGMEAVVWKKDWQNKFQKTTHDTEMAVYCYVKTK